VHICSSEYSLRLKRVSARMQAQFQPTCMLKHWVKAVSPGPYYSYTQTINLHYHPSLRTGYEGMQKLGTSSASLQIIWEIFRSFFIKIYYRRLEKTSLRRKAETPWCLFVRSPVLYRNLHTHPHQHNCEQ